MKGKTMFMVGDHVRVVTDRFTHQRGLTAVIRHIDTDAFMDYLPIKVTYHWPQFHKYFKDGQAREGHINSYADGDLELIAGPPDVAMPAPEFNLDDMELGEKIIEELESK